MRPPTTPWRSSDLEPTELFEQTLGEIREARRRRRKRRLISTIALLTTLVVAAATFVLTQRHVTTTVSLDEVKASFRKTKGSISEHRGSAHEAVTSTRPVLSDAAVASDTGTPGTKVSPGSFGLPAEGVYTYRAAGGESVSIFGARHEYPDHFFATVRHLGGCRWEHRNDVIKEHVDRRVLCGEVGRLSQISQAREVEFFGQRDGGELFFVPPMLQHSTSDEPGTKSFATGKDDEGNSATTKRTFVGVEPMKVGGKSVGAIHFRLDSTFRGKQNGTAVDDLWVSPDTGMTLRWDRHTTADADTAFGANVRYVEEASFILESLSPTT